MLRHIVILKWKEGVDGAHVEATAAALRALPAAIPAIRSYQCGADLGLAPTNYDFGITATFDDLDGFVTYRDHPQHRAALQEMIIPFVSERVAVQVEG